MNKVELEAKLESLTDEINFLRSIYEEVRHKTSTCLVVCFLPYMTKCLLLSVALFHTLFSSYFVASLEVILLDGFGLQ